MTSDMKMKKGFINILELIIALIALFIAFGVLFPGFAYRTQWDKALLLLASRDVILTADRIGNLYSYSFDAVQLSDFLDKIIPTGKTNLIGWSEIEGTIKNRVIVACNCTEQQQDLLYNWTANLTINGRAVDVYVVRTNLDVGLDPKINPSDVLLIWGYKDLEPFKQNLINYLNNENGIVEMMDFPVNPQQVQQQIFGITDGGAWGSPAADVIVKPATANNVTYQAYKIYLNGLKGQSSITPEFCKDPPNKKIVPTNSEFSRVLMQVDSDTGNRASCIVLNGTKDAKTAWIADFTNIAYNANHTKLLTSVLLSVSNKKVMGILSPNVKVGYITSYVNVKNADMFEVYRFNLGLGHPY
jgi:hypothetical protein